MEKDKFYELLFEIQYKPEKWDPAGKVGRLIISASKMLRVKVY